MFSWFETDVERAAALADLKALSPAARRLLSEVVAQQELTRKLSAAARALNDAGFLLISEPDYWSKLCTMRPSLWGEEALELYDAAVNSHTATRNTTH